MNKLKVLRTVKDMKQTDLARLAGVSYQTVSACENRIGLASEDVVRRLAKALEIPTLELIYLMLPEDLTPDFLKTFSDEGLRDLMAVVETN